MARIGALFGRAAAVRRSGQADSDPVRDGAALQKVQIRVQVDGSLVRTQKLSFSGTQDMVDAEIKELIKVQAPLTDLFIKMAGFVSQQNQLGPDGVAQWLNLMCLIVKVYHSLCVQDIPEYFEVTFPSKIV